MGGTLWGNPPPTRAIMGDRGNSMGNPMGGTRPQRGILRGYREAIERLPRGY